MTFAGSPHKTVLSTALENVEALKAKLALTTGAVRTSFSATCGKPNQARPRTVFGVSYRWNYCKRAQGDVTVLH